MSGHSHTPHESLLPVHPLPDHPNVNVDYKVDGRLPGGGRVPGSGAMTNPSEWTNKPKYQTGRGQNSDWAVQETYAQIPGIPADSHLYFNYPGLEDYWSAEQGEVPEPYVAAAYIKWFVSGWESAHDKDGESEPVQSASLEDIAAALERRDPEMLSVLSQCATDHHNVAEISRDSGPRSLKKHKANEDNPKDPNAGANTSVVPYAVQHLVEILPNTRSDYKLSDRASVQNTRRLRANSHAAGAGSSRDPRHPKRSLSWGYGKSKNQPDTVVHHAQEQVNEASEEFAKLAFRNGGALAEAVSVAVANNTPSDYDQLPKYVGNPLPRNVDQKAYRYKLDIQLPGREVTVNIDPVKEIIFDSIGSTLVRYDEGRTILRFSPSEEVIIDESLSYEEAMIVRSRYSAIYRATGKIALPTEAPAVAPNDFVHSHSDIATKAPLLSRAETGSPLISSDPNFERDRPKKMLDVRLTNGEILHVFNDGTTRLNDGTTPDKGTVISRRIITQEDGSVYTAIEGPRVDLGPGRPPGPRKPLIAKEVVSPLRAYKIYMRLNRADYPGIKLNDVWREGSTRHIDDRLRQTHERNAQALGLVDGNFRVKVGDRIETDWHILGRSIKPTPNDRGARTKFIEIEGPGGNVMRVSLDDLHNWQFLDLD